MIIQFTEVKDLFEEYNKAIRRAEKIATFTRNIDLQKKEVETLNNFIAKAKKLTLENKLRFSELELNFILCLTLGVRALQCEISMIICLKTNEMSCAWESLIEAQNLVSSVARNNPIGNGKELDGYAAKLQAFEKLLFPKMIFASTGGIVKESRCTICGNDYETCDHMKGKMYRGDICAREILEMRLEEVSLVENPANKLCHQLSVNFDGREVDTFTLT